MSSAPTLGSQSLEHGKYSPEVSGTPAELPFRFLDLEPELRNRIYEQTFFAEAQTSSSGLAPHALTRVSQQVRRESLGLYYSSVETLEIPLYDEKNVAHVKEWMAESSLQHYPILPGIAFATTANFRDGSELVSNTVRPIFHFKRQIVKPAEELEREVSSGVPVRYEPDMYKAAYLAAHVRCLGLSSMAGRRIVTTVTTTSSAGTVHVSLMPSTNVKPGPFVNSTHWLQNPVGVLAVRFVCGFRSSAAATKAVLTGEKRR
jgi:hypothetical protein